ncbi:hypothetical protein LTR66_004260 [Elasticomyces elasticus]|nr:hypothetical protein LTR66_004260 [Elasticomyces elasticus]
MISKMIDAGSRYRNLEKHMGMGAALGLGTDVAETTWARVLPKKDDKFDQVVAHLRTTALAEVSSRYAQVRIEVIKYQLDAFSRIAAFVPNTRAGTFHTAVDAGSVMEEDWHNDNNAFAGVWIDDTMLGMVNGWNHQLNGMNDG